MANTLNVNLNLNTSDFQRSLVRMQQSLSEFSRNMQRVGQDLTQNLSIPLLGVGAAAVKSFVDIDKLERGMVAIMGSSEAAAAELERLKEVAKLPGIGFQEAVQGSINLQAVGFSADEARSTLTGFAKALAATGKGRVELEAIQYQLTQMISKNKILAEDYKVIQSNLPLMAAGMERAFGTKNIEAVRETGISAKEFAIRLSEALSTLPQVEKATGGLGNAFDNFGDSVKFSLAELGRIIAESLNLEGILIGLSEGLASVVAFFKSLSPAAQKFVVILGAILAAVGPVLFILGKLGGLFATLASGFRVLIGLGPKLGAAFTAMTGPVGLTVLAILAAITAVGYLYDKFEIVRRIVNGVGQAFKELANLAKTSFSALVQGFAELKEGNFRKAAVQFGKSLQVLNPIEQGKAIAAGFAVGFQDTTNYLRPTIDKIKKQIQSIQGGGVAPGLAPFQGTGGGTGEGEAIAPKNTPREIFDIEPLTRYRKEIKLTGEEEARISEQIAQAQANSALATTQNNAALAGTRDVLAQVAVAADSTRAYFEQMNVSAGLLGQGEWISVIETAFDTLGSSLQTAITNTENFGKAVKRAFLDILGVVINEIVLYQIRNFLASPAGLALGPIGGAAALATGKALGSIVKGLFGSVKLAKGGLAFGPTAAIVGDNPAARTDPEVIAPLSKLKDYLNPGGAGMIAEARISGNDLLILVNNAQRANNRIR